MKQVVVINDPPYGTERAYNALRLARSLLIAGEEVRVFLMGDGVGAAMANQKLPDGYYKLDRMIGSLLSKNGEVRACGYLHGGTRFDPTDVRSWCPTL